MDPPDFTEADLRGVGSAILAYKFVDLYTANLEEPEPNPGLERIVEELAGRKLFERKMGYESILARLKPLAAYGAEEQASVMREACDSYKSRIMKWGVQFSEAPPHESI